MLSRGLSWPRMEGVSSLYPWLWPPYKGRRFWTSYEVKLWGLDPWPGPLSELWDEITSLPALNANPSTPSSPPAPALHPWLCSSFLFAQFGLGQCSSSFSVSVPETHFRPRKGWKAVQWQTALTTRGDNGMSPSHQSQWQPITDVQTPKHRPSSCRHSHRTLQNSEPGSHSTHSCRIPTIGWVTRLLATWHLGPASTRRVTIHTALC